MKPLIAFAAVAAALAGTPAAQAQQKFMTIGTGGVTAGGHEIAQVMRNGQSHNVALLSKEFKLQGGDTVFVDRAPVFYVYGEVARAGAYRLENNMTVVQAIAAGGGITPRGSHSRLKLRRADAGGKVVEKDVSLQDRVKADDVIFVKEALF